MSPSHETGIVITYYSGQSREIAELFHRAVHEIAKEHYSPSQLQAWSPEPIDYERWYYRCELKRPFVYLIDGTVHGFIEFDPDGHIDCHYVLPGSHRQGIGGALLSHVTEIATKIELPRIYVEASHVAKGLYLKHGFTVVRANEVHRIGEVIPNWIMEKQLQSSPSES